MSKQIFMCVNFPIYNEAIGISKKIKTQVETFEKLGFEVTYSVYLENGVAVLKQNEIIHKFIYPSFVPKEFYGVIRRFILLKVCKRYLVDKQFNLGFIRWDAVDKDFLSVLYQMKKSCGKVLMDCHGYFPGFSGVGLKGKYTKYMTNKNWKKMQRSVDLCLTESKNDYIFNIKAMPIDTGIDVNQYSTHAYTGKEDEVHMISVANETEYHGYDRVLCGLFEFRKKSSIKVYIHLVGNITDKTISIIKELGLEDCVLLYGYQKGKKLQEIYDACNIGIGPLAPHRVGGKQGTGIKTKEYFAIGLPYFYAGQELLVPQDFKYVLQLDADDTPIDISKVVHFWNNVKNDSNKEKIMREFAKENYSWEKIFRKAMVFLDLD